MNNNNGNNITGGGVASNRTIASCYMNGATHIPLPKTYTTNMRITPTSFTSSAANTERTITNGIGSAEKWKAKYEETERKRKALLTQSERTTRDLNDLNKKYDRICEQNQSIVQQLAEKHGQLEKLRSASKDFYLEYDTLKNKYDVETGAYRKAIQQSSKWYRENNKLKRKSAVLVQRMLQINPDEAVEDFKDVVDNSEDSHSDAETEDMRRTIQELSDNVARLQTELNTAKLMEFEATEQTVNLSQELETEREKRRILEFEIEKLTNANEHMSRVSKLVASEVANLRDSAQRDRESVAILRNEADTARKERNILAHQSALLMGEIMPIDGDDKFLRLVMEVENLKTALEEEKIRYNKEICELQEKIEEHDVEAQLEILEEKLKLAETELQHALERAEKAEKECELLKKPPVPPPPPPPPFTMMNYNLMPTIKLKTAHTLSTGDRNETAVQDMEQLLGIEQNHLKKPLIPPAAAIDDVINQIKGGRFTLKATDKFEQKKPREEPAAVKEMLNVLGTLRRRQKPTRKFAESAFGDVQL